VLEVGVEEVDCPSDLDGFEDALAGPLVEGGSRDLEDAGDVVRGVDGLAAVGFGEFFADELADVFPGKLKGSSRRGRVQVVAAWCWVSGCKTSGRLIYPKVAGGPVIGSSGILM
jgi:hypothetical protein